MVLDEHGPSTVRHSELQRHPRVRRTDVVVRIEPMAGSIPSLVETPPHASAGSAPMQAIRRHPLAAFYGITFGVSWGYWITDALAGGRWSHAPGLVGPMIAAIVVTGLTEGSVGLRGLGRRMLRWRVRPRWYLWVLAPVAVASVWPGSSRSAVSGSLRSASGAR
jgi:hypothetical protein